MSHTIETCASYIEYTGLKQGPYESMIPDKSQGTSLPITVLCSVTKNQTIFATYLMDFIFSLMSYNYCSINVRNTLIDNYFGIINFIGTGEERTKIGWYFSDVGRQPLKISL